MRLTNFWLNASSVRWFARCAHDRLQTLELCELHNGSYFDINKWPAYLRHTFPRLPAISPAVLKLRRCFDSNSVHAVIFLAASPRLKSLDLSHSSIDSRTLEVLKDRAPYLTHLSMESANVKDSAIVPFLASLSKLTNLDVRHVPRLASSVIDALIRSQASSLIQTLALRIEDEELWRCLNYETADRAALRLLPEFFPSLTAYCIAVGERCSSQK